jgi:hypothetical protein
MGQRFCIFCGDTANSREHLLPEWLQNVLPSDEIGVVSRDVGGVKTSWAKKRFSEKTRRVCSDCNEGWMSRLEGVAKPVLAPAIARSQLCAFDLRAQWVAAQWATKTGYVFQTLGREMLAPQSRPVLLRMNGKPPPEVSVFLGSHYRALRDPANSIYMQKPLELVLGDDDATTDFGYLAFLAVGGVSFLIVEHQIGRYAELVLGEMFQGLFTKIWPWSSRVVSWPPEMLMDQELVEPFFLDSQPPSIDVRIFDLPSHTMVSAWTRAGQSEARG